MIETEKYEPPVEPEADKIHRLVKAGIGALPMLSGTIVEVFNALVENPLQKRRGEWLHALSMAINKAEIDIEKLQTDQEATQKVLSAILQSTDIALKTNDKNVHETLIRMVLHTLRNSDEEDDVLSVYFSTARQMTSSHFTVLTFVSNRKSLTSNGGELKACESAFISEVENLDGKSANIPATRILKDLVSMELIYSPERSPSRLGGTNYCTHCLSQFGEQFLKFAFDTRED